VVTSVAHEEVLRLQSEGAVVIDVLPQKEYEFGHIAGSEWLYLRDLTAESTSSLDKGKPVVVYCADSL
jgi:rhodanese-related sulfurtransferase